MYLLCLHSHHKYKFSPISTKYVFLGYPFGVKGYKIMDLHTHSIFVSRDVLFHESIFPFQPQTSSPSIDPFDISLDSISPPMLPICFTDKHTPIPVIPNTTYSLY